MLSNKWREEAISRFPELSENLEEPDDIETPYMLWFELRNLFEKSYQPPRNEELIKRIYSYAEWCEKQPRGTTAEDDLPTCVYVCFYEHIPDNQYSLADMPRWFTRSEVLLMEKTFSYHVGEEGFRKILEIYDKLEK